MIVVIKIRLDPVHQTPLKKVGKTVYHTLQFSRTFVEPLAGARHCA